MRCAAVLLVAFLAGVPASASEVPAGGLAVTAVGLATRAERIAKLHVQAAQDLVAARARRALAESLRDAEAEARRALARTAEAESREALLLYLRVLDDARPWAQRAPSRDHARRLIERTDELAWVAERGARTFQSRPATAASPAAWSAARVGLLSQRLARERLYGRWEAVDPRPTQAALADEMKALRAALEAEPDALGELQLAENQLQFLIELPPGRLSARQAETAAKAADHILESMARISRRLSGASAPRR